jgi:hypothetical protein
VTNPGTINVSGIFYVDNIETINDIVGNLDAAAGGDNDVTLWSHHASGALTIGSTATFNINAPAVYDDLEGYTIVNHGHIGIATGSSLVIGSATTFIDTGAVSIASGGTMIIEDEFNLEGKSFAPEGAGTLVLASNGTIANGTLAPGSVTFTDHGTLDDVTYRGNLNVANGLGIVGGLRAESADGTGPGTINVTGHDDFMVFEDDETLNNVVINLGPPAGQSNWFNALVAAQSLTIGSSATININAVYADDDLEGFTIVNHGQINVGADSTLDIGLSAFINTGTVSIASGGVLDVSENFDLDGRSFAPEGAGTLILSGTIANGTLAPGSVAFTLDGGTLEDVTCQGSAGSRLFGFGTINGSVGDAGTIEANRGALDITGPITGTSRLVIDAAATLELGGTTTEAVAFNGVSTLKLDTPTSFTGSLGGVSYGDVIDIASTNVTSATLSGTSLLMTLGGGTKLDYVLAGPLADGAVTIGSDGGTGSDITFYQAANNADSRTDFSTMHFIAPAGNDGNVGSAAPGITGPSGIAALADDAVFADGFKAASGGFKGALTEFPSSVSGSHGFTNTFSVVGGLQALISQRDFAALLPPHTP